MRIVLLLVFLIFSFPITAYSWEKVPVPDYVNKKTKSPWNFYDDFIVVSDKKTLDKYLN